MTLYIMAIICWGNLAKAANDTLKIEQSIMGYVETHDENPNAHMGEDYALGAHRLATMLDHSPYSVFNRFLYPQSRSYKAVVDPAGNGDVVDIQAGIDYVNSIGGGVVFIKAGTYNLTDVLTLYSNIELEGEGPGLTILNFTGAAKNIQIVGEVRTPILDTYGIPQNSKTVTGVNSDFLTSVFPGDWMILYTAWYKIASVDSDTELTLEDTYRGPTLILQEDPGIVVFKENVALRNFTVQGANNGNYITSSGVYSTYAAFLNIENVITRDNESYGFCLDYNWQGSCKNTQGIGNGFSGFQDSNCRGFSYEGCLAYGNEDDGFMLQTGSAVPAAITDCDSIMNGQHGFNVNFGHKYSLKGCNAYRNQVDGFRLYGGSFVKILGCHSEKNEEVGIDIEGGASPATFSVIVGNTVVNNTVDSIRDNGTNSIVEHNQES